MVQGVGRMKTKDMVQERDINRTYNGIGKGGRARNGVRAWKRVWKGKNKWVRNARKKDDLL